MKLIVGCWLLDEKGRKKWEGALFVCGGHLASDLTCRPEMV